VTPCVGGDGITGGWGAAGVREPFTSGSGGIKGVMFKFGLDIFQVNWLGYRRDRK
jgi:hypothetical protein